VGDHNIFEIAPSFAYEGGFLLRLLQVLQNSKSSNNNHATLATFPFMPDGAWLAGDMPMNCMFVHVDVSPPS